MRSATVDPPAVTIDGIHSALGNTRVNGPGQNAAASRAAESGQVAQSVRASSIDDVCTMSGLLLGRPLAVNIRATAFASSALAPRP